MTQKKNITKELLVALLPKKSALDILKNEHWYHIPVEKAPKYWPPKFLAFYQGSVFGPEESYKIRYHAEVKRIDIVPRKELFPEDEKNQYKAENLYYRLQVDHPIDREVPIVSYRPRRLVFIPTSMKKFNSAVQINDLFDGSRLEDKLWIQLKQNKILAERQWKLKFQNHAYFLDFAVFCNKGKLAVETDGYTTHYDSIEKIDYDTLRQNEIEIDDWRFLHYTRKQVNEDKMPYMEQIWEKIEQLGGMERPEDFHRKIGEKPAEYIVDDDEDID